MPQNSINTNVSAFVALQNLNTVNNRLDSIQNRVSTGLKVNSAVDDASNFAIAQGTRGNLKAYEAVSQERETPRAFSSGTLRLLSVFVTGGEGMLWRELSVGFWCQL